ncbi:MAG: diacylglycerol kinase family protein [Clostridia bacterium]|nr:diacylglycerol kinase family protein [Clostridia bacterium]
MTLILFNPCANNSDISASLAGVRAYAAAPDTVEKDLTKVDLRAEICALSEQDRVLILGGDGTIMRLANALDGACYAVPVYLWKSGTGNDFLRDLGKNEDTEPVLLNPYLQKLPRVEVKGKTYRYINGIGFGLDGMVCEVTDKLKAKGVKKINYTMESIKLLLGGFKCPSGKVTVDGVTKQYKKIWLASAMYGKYYGGGMRVAPDQERGGDSLTCCVWHTSGKLVTLMHFPKIFTGEHVQYKKSIDVMAGKRITVEFDTPTALQIDGETISGVTSYTAWID